MAQIVLANGKIVYGKLIRKYCAFEGGVRYIFNVNGYEVRCIYDNMNCNYRELVV